ncbi:hypothetical protein N7516_001450 [Penicillium verrucosum]|uniref:uncharacterized protein n=1 Tax=Penicillium verrucosum TaxID=60171 RepID=UPI002545A4AC|nr:uncharacterized protein N7516_001450 [Penicillium verrucosum]KAJ5941282.1 hypothetical protein N7516_001450 [Penicillium verrucosum]
MADQTPMANGAHILQPPSAPSSTTYPAQSTHQLGFPCVRCKARHRRCDRSRPACQSCQSVGLEAECRYPSAALPVTQNKSAEDGITKKTGAPFSEPMFNNASALPTTGDKRPRATHSPSERTEHVNDVVGSTIQHDFSHAQQTQIPHRPPAKRQKISELGSGGAAKQSALEQGQNTPFGTGMPSGSRPAPPLRSISPTLPHDEMELRCNLTTEINVQRMKGRNLAAGPLRNIVKLLMKAKTERPTTEPKIAGSSAASLNDEWREEDDLMQNATVKLEKGGRCSRALLSRFENFLYGPLMSPEEKKMQERIICVEECLSSASAAPTSDHNHLFLQRLKRIIFDLDSYGLDEKDPRRGVLCTQLLTAIGTDSKLSPSNRRKFAELLDPDGEIANVSTGSPGVKAETPISTRKVPPKPTSPRVPSSHTQETPSTITTTTTKTHPPLFPSSSFHPPLFPSSSSHPPLFPSSSSTTTHPPLFPSRSSSTPTPPVRPIDLTDDTMPSSNPFIRPKRRVTSGSQSSQSNDTASPSMEPASKKRPASGGRSDNMAAPASKRAASGTQSSNSNSSQSDNVAAPASNPAASGTQSSNSNSSQSDNMAAPASKRAASGTQSLNAYSILGTSLKHADDPNAAEKLWKIFIADEAPILPILNLEQLKVEFTLAVSNGRVGLTVIDPTFGLCIAIACHLTDDNGLWEGHKWYDAALSNMGDAPTTRPSFQWFHRQILQVHYLHMVGHLKMAWDILSMAIGRAQSLRMQTMRGGCLAVDEESLEQVRLVWQCLWTKKLSLTLQLGVVDQSLDSFYSSPMPMQSHITDNMGEYSGQVVAPSSFLVAYASLFKYTDDLITVENDLRVTRMECPIKWLSSVDLSGFQELNEKLSNWKDGLPKRLEWTGIGSDRQKSPVAIRMCILSHVRYIYFRLRQYRPFFILSLRLSQKCACETSPHLTGADLDSIHASPFLGLVYYSAVKCLIAAQEIVKTLNASYAIMKKEPAKYEMVEYLYAAALILVAARTVPLLMNGAARGISALPTTISEELSGIDILLRNYQESCEQAPKLQQRIARSRAAVQYLTLQSVSCEGVVTDNRVKFKPVVWGRIYDRLDIDLPFPMFLDRCPSKGISADGSVVSGRRKTFGWLESLTTDHVN